MKLFDFFKKKPPKETPSQVLWDAYYTLHEKSVREEAMEFFKAYRPKGRHSYWWDHSPEEMAARLEAMKNTAINASIAEAATRYLENKK